MPQVKAAAIVEILRSGRPPILLSLSKSLLCRRPVAERRIDIRRLYLFEHEVHGTNP